MGVLFITPSFAPSSQTVSFMANTATDAGSAPITVPGSVISGVITAGNGAGWFNNAITVVGGAPFLRRSNGGNTNAPAFLAGSPYTLTVDLTSAGSVVATITLTVVVTANGYDVRTAAELNAAVAAHKSPAKSVDYTIRIRPGCEIRPWYNENYKTQTHTGSSWLIVTSEDPANRGVIIMYDASTPLGCTTSGVKRTKFYRNKMKAEFVCASPAIITEDSYGIVPSGTPANPTDGLIFEENEVYTNWLENGGYLGTTFSGTYGNGGNQFVGPLGVTYRGNWFHDGRRQLGAGIAIHSTGILTIEDNEFTDFCADCIVPIGADYNAFATPLRVAAAVNDTVLEVTANLATVGFNPYFTAGQYITIMLDAPLGTYHLTTVVSADATARQVTIADPMPSAAAINRVVTKYGAVSNGGTNCIPLEPSGLSNSIVQDNLGYNPWIFKEYVNLAGGVYTRRTGGLSGVSNGTKATFFWQGYFGADATINQTVYDQGGDIVLKRLSTGFVSLTARDTLGNTVINLVSTNVLKGQARFSVLASIDTTGTSRLWLWQQNTTGLGSWVEEATQTAAGQTLNFTSGNVGVHATRTGTETYGGGAKTENFYWLMGHYGTALDITNAAVRANFIDPTMGLMPGTADGSSAGPVTARAAYGPFAVDMFAGIGVWNNPAGNPNVTGTGGLFACVIAGYDRAHSDFLQYLNGPETPGIVGPMSNDCIVRRNLYISDRTDGNINFVPDMQCIFMENTGDHCGYHRALIYDNAVAEKGIAAAIAPYNPSSNKIYNNLVAYDPAWISEFTLTQMIMPTQSGAYYGVQGHANNNEVYNNVAPLVTIVAPVTGTLSPTNYSVDHTTTGANAWSNLFDGHGGQFDPSTIAEFLAYFKAKTGGPLLAGTYKSGANGTGYVDYVAKTSVALSLRKA